MYVLYLNSFMHEFHYTALLTIKLIRPVWVRCDQQQTTANLCSVFINPTHSPFWSQLGIKSHLLLIIGCSFTFIHKTILHNINIKCISYQRIGLNLSNVCQIVLNGGKIVKLTGKCRINLHQRGSNDP